MTALFLLFVVLPITYGLYRSYYGFTQFGLVPAAAWGFHWVIIGTIFFFPLTAWGFFRWKNSRRSVAVHSGGIHLSLGSRNNSYITWSDLRGLKYESVKTFILIIPLPSRSKLTLITENRSQSDIPSRINHLDQLGNQIKEGYYPTVMTTYRQMFRTGHPILFGPLQLDKMGLRIKDVHYGWEDIQEVDVRRGKLVITTSQRKPLRYAVFDIPNLELLLTLINERSS